MENKAFGSLCSPMHIGKTTIRNRFCVAPMSPGFSNQPSGPYTPQGLNYYVRRARGGFGLIYTGAFSSDDQVDPANPLSANPLNDPDGFRKTSMELNGKANAFGSQVFGQITLGLGRNYPGYYAPSPLPVYGAPQQTSPALTVEQIKTKIACCARVAKLMQDSGYAGVELHALHWGYLLDEFAMGITNQRTDEYGGSLENRLRITREALEAVKAACGADFPVSIRLGMKSFIRDLNRASLTGEDEGGRTLEEGIEIARLLEQYGFDALNVDTGIYESFYYACPPMYIERGYAIDMAAKVKAAVSIPVILGGRMGDPVKDEGAIRAGKIDAVALGRPSLADPDFPRKVEMNRPERIRPCIACNLGCLHRLLALGTRASCTVNPNLGCESDGELSQATLIKRVLVIGGGVAGMEFARTAALRGHQVSLYEASGRLGGNLIPAGAHDFKVEIRELDVWYQRELAELQVDIQLHMPMDGEKVKALQPDVVALAVGSAPVLPQVPGIDLDKVLTSLDVLNRRKTPGNKVVVVGGGLVGCEMALEFLREHKDVTIVEALDNILTLDEAVPLPNKSFLLDVFRQQQIKIKTGTRLSAVTQQGAVVVNAQTGEEETLEADTVVIAVGFRPLPSMARELHGAGIEVFEVGDGKQVGNILTAIWDAHEVAHSL